MSSFDAILVINNGSSSIKCAIRHLSSNHPIFSAQAEKLGSETACVSWEYHTQYSKERIQESTHIANCQHDQALAKIFEIIDNKKLCNIKAVGHRVVHGGEYFRSSILITKETLNKIKECSHLAPLHNPINVLGIEVAQKHFPKLPHVAVFDTSFHQTIPQQAYFYGVPYHWYRDFGIRKYGFHGTSYRYVSNKYKKEFQAHTENWGAVVCHLGNGSSVCAIESGESKDTSMGLTPLDGLIMGTRSGSIDPGLIEHMVQQTQVPLKKIMATLNKESGLLGLSQLSNDMRELLKAIDEGNDQAKLAVEVFCFKVAKEILAMCTSLSQLDAIIFTGGIGEHSPIIRQKITHHLAVLKLILDLDLNTTHGSRTQGVISDNNSSAKIIVIATDEEMMITKDTLTLTDGM